METKLKPCPFCGSTDLSNTIPPGYVDLASVRCLHCGGIGGMRESEAKAAEAWNQRADQSGVTLNLQQAQELLGMFGGEEAAITVTKEPAGHSGPGLYAYHADYPGDGSVFLGRGR